MDHARSLSEVPRRILFGQDEDLGRGTFDKVVRSEPLARAARNSRSMGFQ
jgi:hypothetical protein